MQTQQHCFVVTQTQVMCRVICEAENIHNQVVNTNATKSGRIHDGQKGWGTSNLVHGDGTHLGGDICAIALSVQLKTIMVIIAKKAPG